MKIAHLEEDLSEERVRVLVDMCVCACAYVCLCECVYLWVGVSSTFPPLRKPALCENMRPNLRPRIHAQNASQPTHVSTYAHPPTQAKMLTACKGFNELQRETEEVSRVCASLCCVYKGISLSLSLSLRVRVCVFVCGYACACACAWVQSDIRSPRVGDFLSLIHI